MILGYRFKNFFSFAEETEVSLVVSQHVPESDSIAMSDVGTRVSKVMAIMGPNAGGKTNLLKPLPFIHWFINHSFQMLADQDIPLQPHMLFPSQPSEFEVEFDFADSLWKYQLHATTKRVIWEALYRKTSRYSYVFTREWDPEKRGYNIKQKNFGLNKREAEKVRANASLISTAAQYGVELAIKFQYLVLESNVDYLGRVKNQIESLTLAADFYKKNPVSKDHMVKLLKGWDLGLEDVDIREANLSPIDPKEPDQKIDYLVGIHRNKLGMFELIFQQESSGTQGALTLLCKILPVLKVGGLAVIDELEADLHPHMLEPILNLFLNKKTNPHNAQFIFTCHAAEVLNYLYKSQVIMVEKNEDHVSKAWRLDEVQGIRADDNLYAKYMAGAYAAIPKV